MNPNNGVININAEHDWRYANIHAAEGGWMVAYGDEFMEAYGLFAEAKDATAYATAWIRGN